MLDQYEFRIEGESPLTLPVNRLAEYMKDLALLIGCSEDVHFVGVDEGSHRSRLAVKEQASQKVEQRLRQVKDRKGPAVALRAFEGLDEKLYRDGTSATLSNSRGLTLTFPGRSREVESVINRVSEVGFLEGELVQIGGRDDSISIYLKDGSEEHICRATREQGTRLAALIWKYVRVHGTGRWCRDERGSWKLEEFQVTSWNALELETLRSAVGKIRALPKPEDDATVMLTVLRGDDRDE
jgi:hypothetical protein